MGAFLQCQVQQKSHSPSLQLPSSVQARVRPASGIWKRECWLVSFGQVASYVADFKWLPLKGASWLLQPSRASHQVIKAFEGAAM